MKHLFVVLAACGSLAAVDIAHAAPAPLSAAEKNELARADQWLQAAAAWGNEYAAVSAAEMALLDRLIEGGEKALNFYEEQDSAGGRAWASTWGPAMRAELAGLRTRLDAIPKEPPSTRIDGFDLATNPKVARAVTGMAATHDLVSRRLASTERLVLSVISTIEKVAAGDAEAGPVLGRQMFALSRAAIEAETTQAESQLKLGFLHGSPQESVMRGLIGLNDAYVELISYLEALTFGEVADREAAAKALDAGAASLNTARADMTARAAAMRRDLARQWGGDAPLIDRIVAALDSYRETADSFAAIESGLRQLAALVRREGEADMDGITALMTGAEPHINAITAQDLRRRQMIAGT